MNTKSVVAAKVAKAAKAVPKVAKAVPKVAKAVVKKPKVVKAAKAAKAVVKKPKATPKAAKAVVKKPKAAPKVAKYAKAFVKKPNVPKAAEAAVKKPRKYNNIRGGVWKSRSSALTSQIYARLFTKKQPAIPSNVVVPLPLMEDMEEVSPVAIRSPPNTDAMPVSRISRSTTKVRLRDIKPLPNGNLSIDLLIITVTLNKILEDYKTLFVEKIIVNNLTAYDLITLIDKLKDNLNTFFETFLKYYPTIKFEDEVYLPYFKKIVYDGYPSYQYDFIELIIIIGHFIDVKSEIKLSSLCNVFLDKMKGEIKERYKNEEMKFFKSDLINYDEKKKIYIGMLQFIGNSFQQVEVNQIVEKLHYVLHEFFKHIQSSIILGNTETDEDKRKFIDTVSNSANKILASLVKIYNNQLFPLMMEKS
jgi:hypothetical protein